jgi:hypothetical protein
MIGISAIQPSSWPASYSPLLVYLFCVRIGEELHPGDIAGELKTQSWTS